MQGFADTVGLTATTKEIFRCPVKDLQYICIAAESGDIRLTVGGGAGGLKVTEGSAFDVLNTYFKDSEQNEVIIISAFADNAGGVATVNVYGWRH